MGDYPHAVTLLQTSLTIFRTLGDREQTAWLLGNLGKTWLELGDCAKARELLDEAIHIFRSISYTYGLAWSLVMRGEIELVAERYHHAEHILTEALRLFKHDDKHNGLAWAHLHLAGSLYAQARYRHAIDAFAATLPLFLDLQDTLGAADAIEGLASAMCMLVQCRRTDTGNSVPSVADQRWARQVTHWLSAAATIRAAGGDRWRASFANSTNGLLIFCIPGSTTQRSPLPGNMDRR